MRLISFLVLAAGAVFSLGAAASAPFQTAEYVLSLDVAGHDPGGPEQLARGAERLCAGPEGRLALFDPTGRRILVIDNLTEVDSFPVTGATDIAWTLDGDLVVLHDPTRTLSQWTAQGALVDRRTLPDIVPLGGRLVVEGSDVRIADVFGNHHRVATLHSDGLSAPTGKALIPQENKVRWNQANRTLSFGEQQMVIDAVTASGQAVGHGWLVVDAVTGSSPITVTRTARHVESGRSISLPSEGRAWVPNGDVVSDESGRLVYLDPRADGLHIVEVTP